MKIPYVSVVVCAYNEAGNSLPLIGQLSRALELVDYEIIYVDDGSTDQTLAELRSSPHDRLTILDLQKNYGQSLALAAGIDVAQGQFIVTMDGDQQNDPADIIPMLDVAETRDVDLVMGIRTNRQDGFLLRRLPSRLANALIRALLGVRVDDYGCGLKVFRAELAKNLGLYGELHRFIPVLAHLQGARLAQIPVRHHPRRIGQSKYGLGRTFRVLSDLVLLLFLKKYLRKPMHLFGGVAFFLLVCGLGLAIYSLFSTLSGTATEGRSIGLTGIVLVMAGLQFLAFGLLAELQMRTYYESQGEKPYKIRRVYRNE